MPSYYLFIVFNQQSKNQLFTTRNAKEKKQILTFEAVGHIALGTEFNRLLLSDVKKYHQVILSDGSQLLPVFPPALPCP